MIHKDLTLLYPPATLPNMAENKGAVMVGREKISGGENNETCVCKEYDLVWGNKVNCNFRKRVIEISKKLQLPQEKNEGANWLMTVMALESAYTFSPKVGTFGDKPDETKKNRYVGLIQFGADAASDIGITRTDLMALTAEKQLDYVEKYFLQKRFNKLLNSRTALYLAVNYPNSAKFAADKNHVVYDSTKAAYDSNDLFKKEKHEYKIVNGKKVFPDDVVGSTYVWEMEQALEEIGNSGKSNKATEFECGKSNNAGGEVNAKGIITYHIFSDGKIEKHIPKEIKEEYKKKYKYVYHDKNNKEHEMCIAEWHTTKEKGVGQVNKTKPTHSKIISDEKVSEGNTSRRVKYVNGDIAEYGNHPKKGMIWLLYRASERDVELLKMPVGLNDNDLKINYEFTSTQRRYTGVNTFAGFIGFLAKSGYKLKTTGSCFSEGSSFPSQEHCNGRSVDTLYLGVLDRDQKVIDNAIFFHFTEVLIGVSSYCKKLTKAGNGGTLHNSHLHSGNFNNGIIEIIKE